ncbi:MAG: glycosyltransferase [Halobacteriales archaeon]
MSDRYPVSVLLPTIRWNRACEQLAAQLHSEDELLVICDTEDDPVASYDPPENVEILVAGEPEGCAAKANAIAYGMERATHDRFIWSDDDYDRGDDWIDSLVAYGEKYGPAAVQPIFSGGGWWRLFEPVGLLLFGLQNGIFWGDGEGGYPWGGGVTFTRDDLDISVDQFVAELRQCISDDNVLHEHVGDAYMIQSMQVTVRVDGDFRDTSRRLIRWMRADHVRNGLVIQFVASLAIVGLALLFPLIVATIVTAAAGLAYARIGYVRWTFLLAYPGLILLPVVLGSGIFIKEVTWGSRRYRINDVNDIEVVSLQEE